MAFFYNIFGGKEKKIIWHSEAVYITAMLMLSFAVAMLTAVCNGTLIGIIGKGIDRVFVIQPLFKSFAAHFVLKREIAAKTRRKCMIFH